MSRLPESMLVGFAAWTLLLLLATVGVYRFGHILRGRAGMGDFPADRVEGQGWYVRAMRAHANCIENLPVFAVLVYAVRACGVEHRRSGLAVRGHPGGAHRAINGARERGADRSRGVGALRALLHSVPLLQCADRADRLARLNSRRSLGAVRAAPRCRGHAELALEGAAEGGIGLIARPPARSASGSRRCVAAGSTRSPCATAPRY